MTAAEDEQAGPRSPIMGVRKEETKPRGKHTDQQLEFRELP